MTDSAVPSLGADLPAPRMPLFPKAGSLDSVLYDYHRRADKMGWSPTTLLSMSTSG